MPKEFTLEELLKVAKEHSTTKIQAVDDIHRFILTFKLKDGQHRVKTKFLYKAYKLWSVAPKSYKEFCLTFTGYFETHTYKGESTYLLNVRPVELMNKADNTKIRIK